MAERSAGRRLAPFRHRDFRLLVVSFLVDAGGSWASGIVVAIWIYRETGSLTLLAVQTAASWIPGLLLAPIAGVIADRYDRRRIMVVCALGNGLLSTCVALTIGFGGPVAVVLAIGVLSAVVASPYRPAAGALTPQVVDESTLPAANSIFATLEELVVVIGPALGGLLLLVGAPWIGVAINAASFFVAAAIGAALSVRSRGEAEQGESVAKQLIAGVHALAAAPTAGVLLGFAALDSLVANLYTVLYIPISARVGLGATGYGFLLAGCALGGVVGALFAERLSTARRLAPVIVGGLLLQALPYAVTPLTDSAVIVVVLQFVSGAGMIVVDVLALTAIQREVPSGRLSRVLGLLEMSTLAAGLAGSFAFAGLQAALPLPVVLVIAGLGASALALALMPLLVRADRRAALEAAHLAGRVTVFERTELLRDVPRTALERLAAAAEPRDLVAGEVLIRQGDPADAIWVLEHGALAVHATTSAGREVALPRVDAPDLVGEIGVLRDVARTATVSAATPSSVLRISGAAYLDAISPDRVSPLLGGLPTTRLARTHPELVPAVRD